MTHTHKKSSLVHYSKNKLKSIIYTKIFTCSLKEKNKTTLNGTLNFMHSLEVHG